MKIKLLITAVASLVAQSFTGSNGILMLTPAIENNGITTIISTPETGKAASMHFRSKASGGWHEESNWQISITGSDPWDDADIPPGGHDHSILIREGHTIHINTGISLNKTVVEGILELAPGGRIEIFNTNDHGITVEDGGIFRIATNDSYDAVFLLPDYNHSVSSLIYVKPGGIISIDSPQSETPGAGFEALATNENNIWEHNSKFIWNNGLTFVSAQPRVYFPNVDESTILIMSVGPQALTQDLYNAGTLTINGILDVRTDINFSAATQERNFRNGITGKGTVIIANGAEGTQNITGENAILGGSNLIISLGKVLHFKGNVTIPVDSTVVIKKNNSASLSKDGNVVFTINGTADLTDINMSNTSGSVEINGVLKTAASDGLRGNSNATVTNGTVNVNPGSTIEYYASLTNQRITSSATLGGSYYNLVLSGDQTKTPASAINIDDNGSLTITSSSDANLIVDASANNIGPANTENSTSFNMDGGRLILGTTGLLPRMGGTYNLTGGTIEFNNNGATRQTIRNKEYQYIIITGSNVGNSNGNITLKHGGSFMVEDGGIFHISANNIRAAENAEAAVIVKSGGKFVTYNERGFNGYNPAEFGDTKLSSIHYDITNITLEPGSTVEYGRKLGTNPTDASSGSQTITNTHNLEYQNLILSGDGDKTAPSGELIIKGDFSRTGDAIFKHNEGLVTFDNSAMAQTADMRGAIFYSLLNQNTSNLNIVSDLSIKNSLELASNARLNLTGGDVTIESDESGTGFVKEIPANVSITYDESFNNRFKVQRYIPDHPKAWQLMAVNTSEGTIMESWQDNRAQDSKFGVNITSPNYTPSDPRGFDDYSPAPSLKYYAPATNTYIGVSSTYDIISSHSAYFIFVRGDRSVSQINDPHTPVILYTRGKLYAPDNLPPSATVGAGQYELIGNPYASSIDFSRITIPEDIENSYTIWDPNLTEGSHSAYGLGGYRTITPDSNGYTVVPGSGNYENVVPAIQPGQAFFLHNPSAAAATIYFSENAKTVQDANVFRPYSGGQKLIPKIRTNLYINAGDEKVLADGTLQFFGDDYAIEADQYDAKKMMNSGENISIVSPQYPLIVDRRPLPAASDTVFYHVTRLEKRNYSLKVSLIDMEEENVIIFFHDSYLNKKETLEEGENDFDFEVNSDQPSLNPDRFYLTFKNKKLPFGFMDAAAVGMDGQVTVNWRTVNAQDITSYTILRSANKIDFQPIGIMGSDSENEGDYTFKDNQPQPGINYYKIKATQKDNEIIYSATISASIVQHSAGILIYPNPVKDNLQLSFYGQPAGKYGITLYDAAGRLVSQSMITYSGLPMAHKLELPQLSQGSYQLIIQLPGGGKEIRQVVVTY